MTYTAYEVDFLPVGSGERSGDAIVARFLHSDGHWEIIVVDGGTRESGQAIVDHIKRHYGATYVDHVVNTHPDADHASGLSVVVEELSVGTLWMHRPWEHSADICHLFHDGRITDNSLSERIKDALTAAYRLEETAEMYGIPIREPFAGTSIGPFTVLSPTREFYQSLLPDFRSTPATKAATSGLASTLRGLLEAASNVVESWIFETLRENGSTSAENETSVVMFAPVNEGGILLTGDAGLRALTFAMDVSDILGINLQRANVVQIPHHGSRNNVSPSVLDRLLGPRQRLPGGAVRMAISSSAANAPKHPRKVVENAFARRGCAIYRAKGGHFYAFRNLPLREGFVRAEMLPFHDIVEAYT